MNSGCALKINGFFINGLAKWPQYNSTLITQLQIDRSNYLNSDSLKRSNKSMEDACVWYFPHFITNGFKVMHGIKFKSCIISQNILFLNLDISNKILAVIDEDKMSLLKP